MWVLVATSSVAIVVFIQRALHYHREQINSTEFLIGVRNVLRRDNVVEAISICDATPGPVARMVKIAILSRDRGREGIRDALDEAGLMEVPRLEERLNVLATIAQIAPLMGLFGTTLGFIELFAALEASGGFAGIGDLTGGIWKALVCTSAGLAVAIFAYAGYNYLVSRVNSIVLDMEKSSTEIQNLVVDLTNGDADES